MKRRDERKNRGKVTVMLEHKRVKAGPSTPIPPWKIEDNHAHNSNKAEFLLVKPSFANSNFNQLNPSARKLAATLWEFQHYLPLSSATKMHRHGVNGGGGGLRQHHVHSYLPDNDPCSTSPDQHPATASSLRRHVAASLMQHHRTKERSNHVLQPMSPASYGSSMEVTPYHQVATPSSSIEFKGRKGETSFNIKTSTELLKVLNRIWSLEEQHASNVSLIKALKTELDHTRLKVKELIKERKSNRQEIDGLMKQITEDKLVRKKKEQDQINAAVKSMKEEVEDERRLRKRSESLHRKLARELTEAKSSLYNAVKEMEKERKSREVLEDLCDEFAKGIKEYEQEVHGLRQKCDKDWTNRADFDGLLLHTSESWLDERMQMKLRESQSSFTEQKQNSIVDKLSSEIETLFKAKQVTTPKGGENILKSSDTKNLSRRRSVESVPLHGSLSAPQDDVDEDEAGSNTNCFEVNKPTVATLLGDEDSVCVKNKQMKGRHPSSLQVKFEEETGKPFETVDTHKSEMCEVIDKAPHEGNNIHGSNSNSMIDHLIMSQYMSSGSRNMHLLPEVDLEEGSYGKSIWRSRVHASPVQQWNSKLISTDLDAMESSTKLHMMGPKENNSLKAKLLEARSKGHARHHSLTRSSK